MKFVREKIRFLLILYFLIKKKKKIEVKSDKGKNVIQL